MTESKNVAKQVKIYPEGWPVEKGGLLARGVYKGEGFSEKSLELDDHGQAFVIVDGEKVYLVNNKKSA